MVAAAAQHQVSEWVMQYYSQQALLAGVPEAKLNALGGWHKSGKAISGNMVDSAKVVKLHRLLHEYGYQEKLEIEATKSLFESDQVNFALISNAKSVAAMLTRLLEACQYNLSYFQYSIQTGETSVRINIEYSEQSFAFYSPQSVMYLVGYLIKRIFPEQFGEYTMQIGVVQSSVPDRDAIAEFFQIHCNVDCAFIDIPKALYELNNRSWNPHVHEYLESLYSEHFPDASKRNKLIEAVKSLILQTFETEYHKPSIEQISGHLNMSRSTLYRNLSDSNVTFKELVELQRKEFAAKYVKDPQKSLTEISEILGYSSISAFTRAFKRWFNVSPSAWRS